MSEISILVTGGTGFLGSAIVDALQEKHPKWSITVFDLKPPTKDRDGVRYLQGDITNTIDVRSAMKTANPTCIIHTAGVVPDLANRYGRKSSKEVYDINVGGTQIILASAKEFGTEAFVWTSSCCCVTDDMSYQYPNIDESWPTSSHSLIYGESKATAEILVLAASDSKLSTCALRPPVLFGPDDYQFVPSIYACIAKRETPFIIGSGENMWDVMFVTNAADAHVLAAENLISSKTAAGQAFFISNNEPVPFRDLCLAIWAHFGHYPPFEMHIPEGVAKLVGRLGEWITWLTGNPVTLSSGSVLDACGTRYCNSVKAEKILGYVPRIGIEEGIRLSCKVSISEHVDSCTDGNNRMAGVCEEAKAG